MESTISMKTLKVIKNYPIFSLWLIFSLLVFFVPQIDLTVSGWFYHQELGFHLKNWWLAKWLYDIFAHKIVIYILFLSVSWLLLFIPKLEKLERRKYYQKSLVYWLLCILLSGIVVEAVLKNNWHRARPAHIEQFGGEKAFSKAYIISDQCDKNCSFVSGHAAIGYSFLVLGFIFRFRRWFVPGVVLGVALSFTRIIQGGHFFSDVFIAGFIVYGICYLLDIIYLHKIK